MCKEPIYTERQDIYFISVIAVGPRWLIRKTRTLSPQYRIFFITKTAKLFISKYTDDIYLHEWLAPLFLIFQFLIPVINAEG